MSEKEEASRAERLARSIRERGLPRPQTDYIGISGVVPRGQYFGTD